MLSPMRTHGFRRFLSSLILASLPAFALPGLVAGEPLDSSVSLPLKRLGAYVRVSYSGGPWQLVLEARSGEGWKPIAVQYVSRKSAATSKSTPGTASFKMPSGYRLADLRVLQHPMDLPAKAITGQKDFSRPTAQTGEFRGIGLTGDYVLMSAQSPATSITTSPAAPITTVEESDIWKVVGDRLFFFNQYRGLQVFDISSPQQPQRTGTLRLAASGEQFFSLDSTGTHVALLARDTASASTPPGYRDETHAIHVLAVANGVPALVASLPLSGQVADSRLIGSRLYVLCHRYYQGGTFDQRNVVYGFDLSDPLHPAPLHPLELGQQSQPQLQASNNTLLVAEGGPSGGGTVSVLDISAPDGQPVLRKTLQTCGTVQDKFKLDVTGDVITAVSHAWSNGRRETWVETFPATGASTAPLGRLEIEGARGETLYATRFDGNRLYVVTFRNIDPLFVVDLADPSQPIVTGHLEVPGWSTYIAPWGERLVSVGVEGNRVAVSLFDVSNTSAPALISRVLLGTGWSWSEANYDEKAVGFFPEDGVLLVPFQSYANGWQNQMAVLSVTKDSLELRNAITHEFTARRAAVVRDHILSISGRELLVVNASGLDSPDLAAQLSLSWRVDRVLPFGPDHLIQVEEGAQSSIGPYFVLRLSGSADEAQPMLRVTRADDPDALVEELDLGEGSLVGLTRNGDRVLVAQLVPARGASSRLLRTWVFDASTPPVLRQITQVDAPVPDMGSGLDFSCCEALWPTPETLVWYAPAYRWRWWGPIRILPTPALGVEQPEIVPATNWAAAATVSPRVPKAAAVPRIFSQPASTNPRFPAPPNPAPVSTGSSPATSTGFGLNKGVGLTQAEPVAEPARDNTVAILFPLHLSGTGSPVAQRPVIVHGAASPARPFSGTAFAAGGFVFLSYDEETPSIASRPGGRWLERSWLKVVDFRFTNPVIRNRVSLPGNLLGISDVTNGGALLFTDNSSDASGVNSQAVVACAYDGVSAYRVDTWTVSNSDQEADGSPETAISLVYKLAPLFSWLATATDGTHVFVSRSDRFTGVTVLGFDAARGKLVETGTWSLPVAASNLRAIDGYLLGSSWGRLDAALIQPDGSLNALGTFNTPTDLSIQVSRASIDPEAGIWLPVLDYGVEFLSLDEL